MKYNNQIVEIFTDGACRGNPGAGGWGAILRYKSHEKHLNGAENFTTNNKMELLAVIRVYTWWYGNRPLATLHHKIHEIIVLLGYGRKDRRSIVLRNVAWLRFSWG
jgi:hypothetical protein